MLRTLALALVFGTTVLFSSLYAYATDHDSTGKAFDLSGVGHCSGRTITIESAWFWRQSPGPASVASLSDLMNHNKTAVKETFKEFISKNAIVWTGDGAFEEFLVDSVDDTTSIVADRNLTINGVCHFTIDKFEITYLLIGLAALFVVGGIVAVVAAGG
jgi:hypothetical protein